MRISEAVKKDQALSERKVQVIGAIIMLIPTVISILFSYNKIPSGLMGLFSEAKRTYPLQPDLISALIAAFFYVGLILRYDFFKKDTSFNLIFSIFSAIVNIWTLASMFRLILGQGELQKIVLICAVGFTWLGMRSISGYSWIIFVVLFVCNIGEVNEQMGMLGAVFIIAAAISLLLQSDKNNLKDFMSDFKGKAALYSDDVRENVVAAMDDASEKARGLGSKIGLTTQKHTVNKTTDKALPNAAKAVEAIPAPKKKEACVTENERNV